MFWKNVVLATLNAYSIFSRFAERPERDPDEDYNLSRLVLAWIETIMISIFLFYFVEFGLQAVRAGKSAWPGKIPDLSRCLWMLSAFSLLLYLPSE